MCQCLDRDSSRHEVRQQARWTAVSWCISLLSVAMFSSFTNRSHPDTVRSISSINSDAVNYVKAAAIHQDTNPSQRLDPANFNSTEALPVAFILTFALRTLLQIFPPPPLHLVLGITKTIFHYLDLLCPLLANDWLFSINVRRSDRHGGSDFSGNDCRIIIKSSAKLSSQQRFPARISERGYDDADLQRLKAIALLPAVFSTFNDVVDKTMSLSLHPLWSASIDAFRQAFSTFITQYNKVTPQLGGRNPARLTPKIQCLLHEVPLWIEENKCSLNQITEQGFEHQHKAYLSFEQRYKIPRCGTEILPSVRARKKSVSKRSPHEFAGRHTPSSGTRSGQTKKKNLLLVPQLLPKKRTPLRVVGATRKARALRRTTVAAYNSNMLPSEFAVQLKQIRVVERIAWENSSSSSAPEPDAFQSDGREGSTLSSHVREWRSNDVSHNRFCFYAQGGVLS